MKHKASGLDLALWDKPPYYEHEVISNLEEISNSNTLTTKGLEKNLGNISQTLNNASDKLASTIENEAEKSRIQQAIESEKIQNGISEVNYNLLDVANGIDELNDTTWRSAEEITKSIDDFSDRVVDRLNITNDKLNDIDIQLDISNASLKMISSHLVDLIKMIAKPNETEALELANQARENIALGKKDRALVATRKALDMSNGTSITVLAYHILTLSLFKDDDLVAELLKSYEDFVNLVSFKISDKQSDEEIITKEVDSVVFPVMSVMGYYYRDIVMQSTQKMYTALYQVRSRLSNTLRKPLMSQDALGMISHPNFLREMHWSLLLTKYVIPEKQIKYYVNYILYLANSNVLIKNELAIFATKHFYEEGFLYAVLVDILDGNNNEDIHNAIKIIISILPQDIIKSDYKTLWALELYVKKYNLKTNSLLEEKLKKATENIRSSIKKSYITPFKETQQILQEKQNQFTKQKTKTMQKNENELNATIEETKQFNYDLENKYKYKLKTDIASLNTLSWSSGVVATIIIIILITLWIQTSDNMFNVPIHINPFAHIWDAIKVVFCFALGVPVLNGIIKSIKNSYKSYLEKNIRHYEIELDKRKNVEKIIENLQNKHSQTLETLTKQYDNYIEEQINTLQKRLNSLIDEYTPAHTEQLSKPKDEFKKFVEQKILGSVIKNKSPNDLFVIKEDSERKRTKQTYVEFDLPKVAEEYGVKWTILHKDEQPTAGKLIKWIEGEANHGDAKAQYLLGSLYEGDEEYGIDPDRKKSLSWYEKAAHFNIAEAQCKIGEAYLSGDGYEQNMLKALQWYKKAKELGHPSGKFNYGLILFTGLEELIAKPEEGIYWIKEARDDGLEHAKEFMEKEGLE